MTMSITGASLMVNEGDSVYYSEDWRLMIETHLLFLINHPYTTDQTIAAHDVYKYEGDLYGMLAKINIPPQYHYIVMRMNEMTSPVDFRLENFIPDPDLNGNDEAVITLLIPSQTVIESLRTVFQTTYKKVT